MNLSWMMIGLAFGIAIAGSSPPQRPSAPPAELPLASPRFRSNIEKYCERYREKVYADACVADRLSRNGVQ